MSPRCIAASPSCSPSTVPGSTRCTSARTRPVPATAGSCCPACSCGLPPAQGSRLPMRSSSAMRRQMWARPGRQGAPASGLPLDRTRTPRVVNGGSPGGRQVDWPPARAVPERRTGTSRCAWDRRGRARSTGAVAWRARRRRRDTSRAGWSRIRCAAGRASAVCSPVTGAQFGLVDQPVEGLPETSVAQPEPAGREQQRRCPWLGLQPVAKVQVVAQAGDGCGVQRWRDLPNLARSPGAPRRRPSRPPRDGRAR